MVNSIQGAFAALSDPARFRAVEALRKSDLCATELATTCSMSNPAMSRHLRVLRKSGLVEVVHTQRAEEDARVRVYRLRADAFRSVREWAEHMEAFWTEQLSAFKSYAEGRSVRQKKQ
jgi:DNA-binding transcriptional ArsR family regulator